MKFIKIVILILISQAASAFEEYEMKPACDSSSASAAKCARERLEFYSIQLNELIEKREKDFQKELNLYVSKEDNSTYEEVRIEVVGHLLNNLKKSKESWSKYTNEDCNSLTGYDLPPKYSNNSGTITYLNCMAHHTKQRILEQESIVYCEHNGGCSY